MIILSSKCNKRLAAGTSPHPWGADSARPPDPLAGGGDPEKGKQGREVKDRVRTGRDGWSWGGE